MSLEDKVKAFGPHHKELVASSNKDKDVASSFNKRLAMFDLLQFNTDFKPDILIKYAFKGKEGAVNAKKNKENAKTPKGGMKRRLKEPTGFFFK